MARWNQTEFESKAAKERARKKILDAARKHDIDVDPDSNVATGTDRAAGDLGTAVTRPPNPVSRRRAGAGIDTPAAVPS
jgi:hypothetical protein